MRAAERADLKLLLSLDTANEELYEQLATEFPGGFIEPSAPMQIICFSPAAGYGTRVDGSPFIQ
jgi:hypothetical protein